MCAAQLGNLDLVKELLQREADVRAMDEVGPNFTFVDLLGLQRDAVKSVVVVDPLSQISVGPSIFFLKSRQRCPMEVPVVVS